MITIMIMNKNHHEDINNDDGDDPIDIREIGIIG